MLFSKCREKFEIVISRISDGNGVRYQANKTYGEIVGAFLKNMTFIIVSEFGTMIQPNIFGDNDGDHIEFTGLTHCNGYHMAVTFRINMDNTVKAYSNGLSPVKIELENVGENQYRSKIDNVLVAIQEMRDLNVDVEVIADCQPYPYIRGNQEEAFFGRIEPETGEYTTFVAKRTQTFNRHIHQLS